MTSPIILWHRQDLRVDDLPALHAAAATGRPIVPCFILDDESPGQWRPGGASRWWLHHSLAALGQQWDQLGTPLVLRRGPANRELARLVEETSAEMVVCSRHYEPWAVSLEETLHEEMARWGVTLKRYSGSLLFEPETNLNGSGKPYRVFTPFWKQCLARPHPPAPRQAPAQVTQFPGDLPSDALSDWELTPRKPDWAAHWSELWQPGSAGARNAMANFFSDKVGDYSEGRDRPAKQSTSRLSPHLHYGELSPRQVWHAAQSYRAANPGLEGEVDKFLSELGWREFSYHLLFHFPTIPEKAFKPSFREFPWLGNTELLGKWERGQTGYPLVDAGMRELWNTGYMHNRVRMIAASFLTKHLLLPWQWGARWFMDTLVDADLANNSCGWQWVAGSGADASPYFRIFNPITQGHKFDGEGAYVRQWLPELADLPDKYLFSPWEAPPAVLSQAGVVLGTHYPHPLVDHKSARESALNAYAVIR
jgi:deoxyribodipyrimidine photo-lyase